MSAPVRRTVRLLSVSFLIVVGDGSFQAGAAPPRDEAPARLASITVPSKPFALAWSADGARLAAGTCYDGPGQVFILDVARGSVSKTLEVSGWVRALAFSPDGKWLAVATVPSLPPARAPARLVVFDVPAFTAKLTVKGSGDEKGFLDLAWAPDGKALCALDGPANGPGKAEVRRWAVPAFKERPAIREPQTGQYHALAVSPDGRSLAVADEPPMVAARWVRLFDTGSGQERSAFRFGSGFQRLGFSPDGKAVGVIDSRNLSWWDPATGRPAEPDPARLAVQPPGLGDGRSHYSFTPDGGKQAHGYEKQPNAGTGLNDLFFPPKDKFGAFVRVKETATDNTRTWRVGETGGTIDSPVVAFSPDGRKLAGTVKQPGGESVVIWAVPK